GRGGGGRVRGGGGRGDGLRIFDQRRNVFMAARRGVRRHVRFGFRRRGFDLYRRFQQRIPVLGFAVLRFRFVFLRQRDQRVAEGFVVRRNDQIAQRGLGDQVEDRRGDAPALMLSLGLVNHHDDG